MLEYEWGSAASILLPSEETDQDAHQTQRIFDPFNQTLPITPHSFPSHHHHHHHHHQQLQQQNQTIFRTPVQTGFSDHIGLNLGVRTYFSSADEFLVSRLYRRTRVAEPAISPRCQAEGCTADLSHAKHYHRRHKVCEFHSKASTVLTSGFTQRFCQQCSRFHPLAEFDQEKRSCRKRLADHNRRRRKSQSQPSDASSLAPKQTPSLRSSLESGTRSSSSSVTVAISPSQTAQCGTVLSTSSTSCFLPMAVSDRTIFSRQKEEEMEK